MIVYHFKIILRSMDLKENEMNGAEGNTIIWKEKKKVDRMKQ